MTPCAPGTQNIGFEAPSSVDAVAGRPRGRPEHGTTRRCSEASKPAFCTPGEPPCAESVLKPRVKAAPPPAGGPAKPPTPTSVPKTNFPSPFLSPPSGQGARNRRWKPRLEAPSALWPCGRLMGWRLIRVMRCFKVDFQRPAPRKGGQDWFWGAEFDRQCPGWSALPERSGRPRGRPRVFKIDFGGLPRPPAHWERPEAAKRAGPSGFSTPRQALRHRARASASRLTGPCSGLGRSDGLGQGPSPA